MSPPESTLQIPKDVLFRQVTGEAVLLNPATNQYYYLDEVGTRMWLLLTEHGQLEPVVQVLLQEYAVEENQLRRDLNSLVDKLLELGLLARLTPP